MRATASPVRCVPLLLLCASTALAQPQEALTHFARGVYLAETEARFREAISEFERAVRLRPQFPEAAFSIGQCYGSLQDFHTAYRYYRRVRDMAPTPELATRADIATGHVLLLGGRHEEAIAALQSAERQTPDDGRLARLLGDAHAAIGRTHRAAAYYRRAVELEPDAVKAHRGLARCLRRSGDLVGAIHHANAAIALDPYDSETFYVLARALARQREHNEACEAMAAFRALQAYEENVKRISKELLEAPTRADLLLQLADHHASAGNADEAIAVYERLVAMDLARPIALTNMGLLRFDDGALTEAESLFREAVELDPSLSQAHLGIATLRARLRQWEEAKVAFEAAMREAPTNVQAHLGRIACFAQLGDEAAAMAAATHWTLQDPSSSLAWGERGLRHYRAGDSGAAISALEKAVELDANNLNAANSLAWSYAEGDENLDRALELVEHVLAAHPHADAYDTLAAVLEKRGDLQAAVDAMTRAVEMQPDKDDYRTRQDQLMRAMDGKHSSR